MFFKKSSSKNHKITTTGQTKRSGGRRDRRLTLEHLESRALLSVSPIASGHVRPEIFASGHGWGGGGWGGSDTPTQFAIVAPPTAQSGVQTTIDVVALDAYGRPVIGYDGSTTGLTVSDTANPGDVTSSLATADFQNGVAVVNVTFASTITGDQRSPRRMPLQAAP